jgi:hypothetical protein
MESPIDDDTAISLAMQHQHMLKAITIQKRREREAEILAATRQLHIAAGRDPDKALDPCTKEEFERINAHAQMISKYHHKQAAELQARKDEEAAYERYKADIAKYKSEKQ